MKKNYKYWVELLAYDREKQAYDMEKHLFFDVHTLKSVFDVATRFVNEHENAVPAYREDPDIVVALSAEDDKYLYSFEIEIQPN